MNGTLAKLNLRPQERRLVAVVAFVLFVVLNLIFVWPHFGDWGLLQIRYQRAEHTLDSYNRELAKVRAYEIKLRELESAGSSVVPGEQELDFVRTINTQATLNRLNVTRVDPTPKISASTLTNRFFEEKYDTIQFTSDNEELVNFLVSLTSTNSIIRVKDLNLKLADAAATKLDGQATLVASYQRATPAKVSSPTRPATTTPAHPANTTAARVPARTNKTAKASLESVLTNKMSTLRSRSTNPPARKP